MNIMNKILFLSICMLISSVYADDQIQNSIVDLRIYQSRSSEGARCSGTITSNGNIVSAAHCFREDISPVHTVHAAQSSNSDSAFAPDYLHMYRVLITDKAGISCTLGLLRSVRVHVTNDVATFKVCNKFDGRVVDRADIDFSSDVTMYNLSSGTDTKFQLTDTNTAAKPLRYTSTTLSNNLLKLQLPPSESKVCKGMSGSGLFQEGQLVAVLSALQGKKNVPQLMRELSM